MSSADDVELAGRLRASDWWRAREALTIGGTPDAWGDVFERFFKKRMETRYLAPIRAIRALGTGNGEGFSMVALQCTLIEFLAASRRGENYRHLKRGEKLGANEYSDSGRLFVEFLTGVEPFSASFPDEASAWGFYGDVRCGLLHEARTKGRWKIWITGRRCVDAAAGVVYRDTLQDALETYIESYGVRLRDDAALQDAFLRKFDVLAGYGARQATA